MKKLLTCLCSLVLLLGIAVGCAPQTPPDDTGNNPGGEEVIDRTKLATIAPTIYDVDEIVTAEETEAGEGDGRDHPEGTGHTASG